MQNSGEFFKKENQRILKSDSGCVIRANIFLFPSMATNEIVCPVFDYGRDASTLGSRWLKWIDIGENFLVANEYDELQTDKLKYKDKLEPRNKARFILLLGDEAREVYNSKRKADKSDTLLEMVSFMTAHFSPVKNEYAEIAAFGRAGRLENESVNDYLMRLSVLATHRGFGTGLEKELERQFALWNTGGRG